MRRSFSVTLMLRGAIHHVVVGDDVSVRRDDDAASHSMLNLRLRGLLLHRPEELLQSWRKALHLARRRCQPRRYPAR